MNAKKKALRQPACPCGGQAYATCCAPLHEGAPAPTAEALMRSRYSAYALGLAPYLLATWAPETRPDDLDLVTPPQAQWIGLQVLSHQSEGEAALVGFVARYKLNGRAHRLHENSRFRRDADGRWLYIDGEIKED